MCIDYIIRQSGDKIKCMLVHVFARKFDTEEHIKRKIKNIRKKIYHWYIIILLYDLNVTNLKQDFQVLIWRQTLDLTGREIRSGTSVVKGDIL